MESNKHHALVKKIISYITNDGHIEKSLIESDIFEVQGKVTRMPEGFIPDVFYSYNNKVIIGEAKTDSDLERQHSFNQYESYLKYLNRYGDEYECVFILAVPWDASKTAFRIIKSRLENESNIKIVILNEAGVFKKYEKNNNSK